MEKRQLFQGRRFIPRRARHVLVKSASRNKEISRATTARHMPVERCKSSICIRILAVNHSSPGRRALSPVLVSVKYRGGSPAEESPGEEAPAESREGARDCKSQVLSGKTGKHFERCRRAGRKRIARAFPSRSFNVALAVSVKLLLSPAVSRSGFLRLFTATPGAARKISHT